MSNEINKSDEVAVVVEKLNSKLKYINTLIDSYVNDCDHVLSVKRVIRKSNLSAHIIKKVKSLFNDIKDANDIDDVRVAIVAELITHLKTKHVVSMGMRSRINNLDANLVNLV